MVILAVNTLILNRQEDHSRVPSIETYKFLIKASVQWVIAFCVNIYVSMVILIITYLFLQTVKVNFPLLHYIIMQ